MTLKERLAIKKEMKEVALDQGFILNDQQVNAIMSGHPHLVAEFQEAGGHDTVTRDLLADVLAGLVGSQEWPLYAVGSKGWNAFVAKVKASALAGKIKIVDGYFEEDHGDI